MKHASKSICRSQRPPGWQRRRSRAMMRNCLHHSFVFISWSCLIVCLLLSFMIPSSNSIPTVSWPLTKMASSSTDSIEHLDQDSRLASLTRLLITLPSANFYTLEKLFEHFHRYVLSYISLYLYPHFLDRLIQDCDDTQKAEDLLESLTSTFSTILLRPQTESNLTLHDRHPQRFVRDMLRHYHDVFNTFSVEAHKQHVNQRRHVADKAPSLEAPSINSSISSMHVDTPTTQSTFNDDAPRASADSASSPTRRRTLLSFMRRGSDRNPQQLERSKSMSTATPRRVLPLPSSSTLFEDPDIAPPVVQRSATQDRASNLINEENEEEEIPAKPKEEQLRSRASTFSVDGSLDSFFKDEEL